MSVPQSVRAGSCGGAAVRQADAQSTPSRGSDALPMTNTTAADALRPTTPSEVAATYRTCELATLTKAGVPVAWPAVCTVEPTADGTPGRITLTTSVALPRKALNVRRDPRVALLFSDPTGTGRTDLPQVHVAGRAVCPEEVRTGPEGLEDYWSRLWERQPDTVPVGVPGLRRLMDVYFFRVVMTVTPEQVETRPALRRTAPRPAVLPVAVPQHDRSAWAEAVRRLPAYDDAVLGLAPGDAPALPALHRVHVEADAEARLLRLVPAAGATLPAADPGTRVSLLFHAHDDRLGALRQHVVLGRVVQAGDGPALRPDRVVDGPVPGSTLQTLRTLVRMRRTARAYLAERGLSRPAVDWAAFQRVKRGVRPSA
jgi:hypothetical protein